MFEKLAELETKIQQAAVNNETISNAQLNEKLHTAILKTNTRSVETNRRIDDLERTLASLNENMTKKLNEIQNKALPQATVTQPAEKPASTRKKSIKEALVKQDTEQSDEEDTIPKKHSNRKPSFSSV